MQTYQNTLEGVFQNPVSSELEWHDIIALIEQLGTVKTKNNGQLTFTVNGTPRIFHRAKDKNTSDRPQVRALREFLESVGINQNSPVDTDSKLRLLVVISQHETLIFRSEEKGTVPEHLHPFDPHGTLRMLKHTRGNNAEARAPESLAYYEAISKTLTGAEEILLMGNGTGASSAMMHLKDYLQTHHKDTAASVVGALTVNLEALTEGQLLQEARTFYRRRLES
jgi:hypothetical protein